jgi:hypothetical protein
MEADRSGLNLIAPLYQIDEPVLLLIAGILLRGC